MDLYPLIALFDHFKGVNAEKATFYLQMKVSQLAGKSEDFEKEIELLIQDYVAEAFCKSSTGFTKEDFYVELGAHDMLRLVGDMCEIIKTSYNAGDVTSCFSEEVKKDGAAGSPASPPASRTSPLRREAAFRK
jgi:hypothetical protein